MEGNNIPDGGLNNTPVTPVVPNAPVTPEVSVIPVAPVVETPSVPEVMPTTPEVAPVVPETPVTQVAPEVAPATPETPVAPVEPAAPTPVESPTGTPVVENPVTQESAPAAVETPTEPVTPVTSSGDAPTTQPVTENKNNKLVPIVIAVVALLVIGVCLCFFVLKKDNNESNGGNGGTSEGSSYVSHESASFNGVYTFGEDTVKLFAKSKDKISCRANNKSIGFGTLDYENGSASYSFFEESVTIRLNNDGIIVESNVDDLKSGTYTKKSDYTLDDYFKERYGTDAYLNGKYTGKFTADNSTVYLYQSDAKSINMEAELESNSFVSTGFDIGTEIMTSEIIDSVYELKVFDDKISLVKKEKGKVVYEKELKKVSSLSKADIIENFDEPFDIGE